MSSAHIASWKFANMLKSVMNEFMVEEFAKRAPGTAFVHTSPGAVNTGLLRDLPLWARVSVNILSPIISLFMVSAEETGQRQLFNATSSTYAPANSAVNSATSSGTPVPNGVSIANGVFGNSATGGYSLGWQGNVFKSKQFLEEYRQNGYGHIIWEHTMGIFKSVDNLNKERD